jgi:hypothetical protein
MEKVTKSKDYSKSYPFAKLFKEDLEQISRLFLDNFSEVVIEADEYRIDNISELNEFKKELVYEFNILGYDETKTSHYRERKMRFYVCSKYSILYIDSDDIKCFGIKNKLEDILKKRFTKLNILNSFLMNIIPAIMWFISFSILMQYKQSLGLIIFILYCIIIFGIMIIFALLLPFLPRFLSNCIYIKYSWERPSFYQRNSDNIIVGGICALFGTVIGGLIVYFVINKLSSPSNP